MASGIVVRAGQGVQTDSGVAPNGFARDRIAEIQRARMLIAISEVACELGVANTAVAHVVERAGVSRRTFYEVFRDCEECFLAALHEAFECARGYVLGAHYDPKASWAARIRIGLGSLLRFLDEEPAMGRLAVVESLGGGTRALEFRRRGCARLVLAVDAGRAEAKIASSCTLLTAEGVVGGVLAVIHAHMVRRDPDRFVDLLNPLMSMIVLPYLGQAAARKESGRAVAAPPERVTSPAGSPLRDLGMRLTYRTVRALVAVAEHPGSSNRVIGEVSGIGDQGQVSKLLARLEKLGLVENARTDHPKGTSNAWVLTKRGGEVADVIAA